LKTKSSQTRIKTLAIPIIIVLTESTEVYSAKNVNPEYIARYKATESNQVQEGGSETVNTTVATIL
jgi:hypothetical protein